MIAAKNLSLRELKPGMAAEILDYAPNSPNRVRFAELGLHPGATVQVLRVAPLGDPIQVQVGGTLLSIRKREAESILVKVSGDL